jgi:pilus assembly protein Flp/PilA
MANLVSRFTNDESGATAIEYGLIAAIIGVGIIVSLGLLEDGLSDIFTKVGAKLTAATV